MLQFRIERGVDAEILVREVLIADALDELIVDEVDEVGSFAGVDVGRCEAERLGFGAAASLAVMAPVSTMESRTTLRRSMARSGWR